MATCDSTRKQKMTSVVRMAGQRRRKQRISDSVHLSDGGSSGWMENYKEQQEID